MTDEEVEMTEDTLPACSSYCEHCDYAMCGDFHCDITDAVTIEDWKPLPCHHPERRKLVDDNAELRKLNWILADCNTCNSTCKTENVEMKEQLTEAKKIIGNLYAICKDNNYPNSSVLMEQAEKFLKEELDD